MRTACAARRIAIGVHRQTDPRGGAVCASRFARGAAAGYRTERRRQSLSAHAGRCGAWNRGAAAIKPDDRSRCPPVFGRGYGDCAFSECEARHLDQFQDWKYSLLGAMLMTYFVNRPFARLARAARQIGAGRMPEQLAEQGSGVIAQTNRSFNQMARDLRQLEEDRTLMLAGISHDLRTPLTRLRLEGEMNSTDAAAQSAMIADIEQIDAILASFLEYARPLPRPLAKVDLALLVRQAAARFARKDSMEIALQLAEPAMIQADAADLRRILDNVLENARKYGRSAEDAIVHVQIALRRQQNQMELLIRDCGPGIAQDQLERVTRPFSRGVAARSQSDGAGLGMAMVQRLVSRCQGALQLRNCSPEPGLEVKLTFPRT